MTFYPPLTFSTGYYGETHITWRRVYPFFQYSQFITFSLSLGLLSLFSPPFHPLTRHSTNSSTLARPSTKLDSLPAFKQPAIPKGFQI